MKIANMMSKYITSETFDNLPKKVVKKAKLHILDTVGNASFNGGARHMHKGFLEVLKNIGGKPEATIIGEEFKAPCTHAAFLNSVMCCLHGDLGVSGHPSYGVIPAALAVGERENISGKDFITSVVVGYEIFERIGRSIGGIDPAYKRGIQPSSIIAAFSATAAAGKALSLDEREMAYALGLAGGVGSGLVIEIATPGYGFQVGKSCEAGVLSALLAKEGLYGSSTVFEGEHDGVYAATGFCHAVAGECDLKALIWGLGRTYEILNSGIKYHGGCRIHHPSIDLAIKITREHEIKQDDIEEVEVKVGRREYYQSKYLGRDAHPKRWTEAVFSIPFAVSVAISDGEEVVGPEKFSEEKIEDLRIKELMNRVKTLVMEEKYPRRVSMKIKTKDGKEFAERIDYYIKGDPGSLWPLTEEEVKSKFRRLASFMFSSDKIEGLIFTIDKIEEVEDITELTELLYSRV